MQARLQLFFTERKINRFDLLALFGALVYFTQSAIYARSQLSVLDEGAYLIKGWWFATGQYVPYQEFGPFTNHMPLAFLIPGWVQAAFGPSLLAGRAFAVLMGLLFLLGLFLLSKRFGGSRWAAVAVWVVALNPALIKMYSVGVTQGMIIAALIWILYLSLYRDRQPWQIYLSMVLAALMALTRLNMTAVLFVLPIYIWSQHGRQQALRAALLGLGIWLAGHVIYWPGILQMWANYTPDSLTPFLDPWRVPTEAVASWTSGAELWGRVLSMLEALRFHFVTIVMAILAALFMRKPDSKKADVERYRAALFVGLLFLLLIGMHAFASLALDFCVFCFPVYSAFYSSLGIVFLILAWPLMAESLSKVKDRFARRLLPLIVIAVPLGAYFSGLLSLFPDRQIRSWLNIELPRFSDFAIAEGTIPLWGLFENRFAFSFAQSFDFLERLASISALILLALLVSAIIFQLASRIAFPWRERTLDHTKKAFLVVVLFGMILSPTPILAGGYQSYDCDQNVIAAYEQRAKELANYVAPGDLVFWRGGRSAIPLLYLADTHTFPPQLNGDYTYRLGGEAEQLARMGLWGTALLEDWLQQADVILVERDLYRTWLQAAIEASDYEQIGELGPLTDCSPRSEMLIFEYRPQ